MQRLCHKEKKLIFPKNDDVIRKNVDVSNFVLAKKQLNNPIVKNFWAFFTFFG